MSVTSWVAANSASNVTGIGSVAWASETNVYTDDTNYAQAASMGAGAASNWLRAYFPFTSSDVPAGATIDGIELEKIVYGLDTFLVKTNAMRLVVGGTINESDVSGMDTSVWGPSGTIGEQTKTYGGASNLWNGSPSQSDITGGSFGIAVSAINYEASKQRNATVDFLRMRIYYTPGTDVIGGGTGGRRFILADGYGLYERGRKNGNLG